MRISQSYPLWISYSQIRDFLNCPRSYFLKHVYKDPRSGKKINIITPPLALGNTVHDVLEEISTLGANKRFEKSLLDRYESSWSRVTGELGGFRNTEEEQTYKKRGETMIRQVIISPGPLLNKAVKLRSPDELPPRYLFSTEENILLCGKVDWLEYSSEDDSIHIIDFKTGIKDEDSNSLQLAIYLLLVKNCQKRSVKKISYWYLEREEKPREMILPDLEELYEEILQIALRIKKLKQNGKYICSKNGCYACEPLEVVVSGKAEYIKTSGYQDIYIIPDGIYS